MRVIRHPKLAEDIRDAAMHYAEISGKVLSSFWSELEAVIESVEKNPRSHHYDSCGLRRANLRRFPYHLLYDVEDDVISMVVFRHDRRHPGFGTRRSMPPDDQ
jgi:plasmid stabilization system protein ParE